jgi:integrase
MATVWKSDDEESRGSIYDRPRSRILWLRYNLDGQEIRESTESADLETAKKYLAKVLRARDAALEGYDEAYDRHKARKRKLVEVLEAYRKEHEPASEPRKRVKFLTNFNPISDFFGPLRAHRLTTATIARYIEEKRADGLADGTIKRQLIVLRAAVNTAHNTTPKLLPDGIKVIIPKGLKAGTRHVKIDPWEYQKLLAELPSYWQGPFRFLYFSGWRVSEMENLEWQDIRGYGDTLQAILPSDRSKTDKCRGLQLTGELLKLYEERLKEKYAGCPFVFHIAGKKFVVENRRESWNGACRRAGVEHKVRHDCRRSTVTDLNNLGISNAVAKSVSGHASDEVFERYNCPSPENQAQRKALLAREAYINAVIREEEERKRRGQIIIMPIGISN